MVKGTKRIIALILALILTMTMALTSCDVFVTPDGGLGGENSGSGDNGSGDSGSGDNGSGDSGSGDNGSGEVNDGIPDVEENSSTLISKILNGSDGQSYTVRGTVVAYNAQSFLIKDSTGTVLVYKGASWTPDVKIGDIVEVSGTRSSYGNAPQFGTDASYEKLDHIEYTQPTPTVPTAAELNAYSSATKVTPVYVKLTGTLAISKSSDGTKTYYNFNFPAATIIGTLTYPTAADSILLNNLDGATLEVEGWITGAATYGKYLNLMTVGFTQIESDGEGSENVDTSGVVINGENIPAYSGNGYYIVNGNTPFFTEADKSFTGYKYSPVDSLGRATGAFARLTKSLFPSDGRESISHIKPSGWVQASYPSLGLDHLYDRSHLLAHMLMSDDVHIENFVTGTVYMNQSTMKSFEEMVQAQVKGGTDVLYRITPVFLGDNLVAHGVLMEAYSVDDGGEDVEFCVYLYNVQPGVVIDYATGNSRLEGSSDDGGNSGDGNQNGGTVTEGLPESDKAYYLTATSEGVTYYVTSKITSKALGTTKNLSEAVKFYLEATDAAGVYYMYYMNGTTKTYITMTSDTTKAFDTSTTATDSAMWLFDASGMYIFHNTYSTRAMAFYISGADIRTYKTSANGGVFLWFTEA